MSIGKNIKQLRELRNYTQSYVADALGLSLNGYGKIERDETDVTVNRLSQIAEILKTDLSTILNFDSSQVFNLYNNKTALANGTVQNQQIIGDQGLADVFTKMQENIDILKSELEKLRKQK